MSGGVNDNLWFVIFKDFVHAGPVGNVANKCIYADCGKLFAQFTLYVEQWIFSLLNKQKQLRCEIT
ncbi:hypothetical protein ES703_88043 [subsurface metagenome]